MSDLLQRLLAKDPTLWPAGNVAPNRLGWLDIARRLKGEARGLRSWAETIDQPKVILLGMGGSSLGPEVLRACFGSDRLVVLDTTDPATIAAAPVDDAFFLVSSKSGGTLEVASLLAHCWKHVPDGSRYAAITDPGTSLAALAAEREFNRVFENPPDIGGRYSVLSYFGMVPAALCGIDVAEVCEDAMLLRPESAVDAGVAMAEAAKAGRDKVTITSPTGYESFGLWAEQLVAESLGKQGRGCIPVPATSRERGDDRYPVAVELTHPSGLGAEFLSWEIATAIAGHVLGVDPFDEPNVAESKANTAKVLDALPLPMIDAGDPSTVTGWLKEHVRDGDYVSLQAYVSFGQDAALETARRRVRDALGGMAVTAGYGPRFLHSTGQLHKGGPNTMLAVQLVPDSPTADLPIPGTPYDFGTLIAAQAAGDLESLRFHDRRVLRVSGTSPDEIA